MSSDFCIKCDNELSVYCGPCMEAVYRERDEARQGLASAYTQGVTLNGRILEAAYSDAADNRRQLSREHERAERFLCERDAARVEIGRLREKLRTVAANQREACAEWAAHGWYSAVGDCVRLTPLVTDEDGRGR